jgi:hypothetical protein
MFYKKFMVWQSAENTKEILNSLYKILIASLVMFVLTFAVRQILGSMVSLQAFWGIFFQLIISGAVGVTSYAFVTYKLKSPENKIIVDSFLKKFFYPVK